MILSGKSRASNELMFHMASYVTPIDYAATVMVSTHNLGILIVMISYDNVKAAIWDLDGTLLDSVGIFEQVIADVAAESGQLMPSNQDILDNYHGSLDETLGRILSIDSADLLHKTVALFLEKQLRHYANDLNTHLFEDAVSLARRASEIGVDQLVITNRDHRGLGNASPRFIVASTVLTEYINEVFPGDEVAYRKPDRRSVGNWIEQRQLNPEEILVLGDQFVDAQLALNIGARAVLIKRNGSIPHLHKLTHENHASISVVDSFDHIALV
jgi:phosphoglycolate phosphatase-like HAD superfamily hydrolase